MMKNRLLATVTLATLALLSGAASADDRSDYGRRDASPTGAWEVITTVRVLPTMAGQTCADTNPVGLGLNPFPAYYTIHKGGTMNEQGTRSSSANRGSGHGLWKRTGRDTFRYRVKFHGFDDNRALVNATTITIDAVLGEKGDQFAGVGGLSQTDLSGNTRNFCLTLMAKRMTLD